MTHLKIHSKNILILLFLYIYIFLLSIVSFVTILSIVLIQASSFSNPSISFGIAYIIIDKLGTKNTIRSYSINSFISI